MTRPGPDAPRRLLGITQSAFDPASRVRFIQFIPALEKAGWHVTHRPNRPDRQWQSSFRHRIIRGGVYRAGRLVMKANRLRDIYEAGAYDVVFVNRDLAGKQIFFERQLTKRTSRIVFDFDDAIFLGRANERIVRHMCEHAAWVTPGNAYLAEFARPFSARLTVIPTVIDTDRYVARDWSCEPRPGPVRVGWTGSSQSIGTTLFPYLPMFARAQRELPFELVIISNAKPTLPVCDLRWSFVPWTPDGEGMLGEMFDIGIMPLVDNAMQRGKCGLKLLQCMAAGLPTIASPVGVNREILVDGVTGYAADEEEQWIEALRALIVSPERRAAMGRAGRARCEERYSIRAWLPTLLDIFEQVGGFAPSESR